MKKIYVAPEADLLKFRAAEALAEGEVLLNASGDPEFETQFGYQPGDGNPW